MTLSKRGCRSLFPFVLAVCAAILVTLSSAPKAVAAPYAAVVMDARSGKVLHSRNADTRLHPASLTKMMTLYIAFEAIRLGEIGLDTKVLISKHAANEVPSKLGLKAGSRIELRYLIRAAAVKSANDAATAIGEAIAGSEAAFARRMNRTAKALGMTRSTFKNAHGLTETGHMSTARDMTILGRHLFYDYPDYYNLFSRTSTDAKLTEVRNTNRKFLAAYKGADGIKTGYTRAAGFNLTASAERGRERIIATVFGGTSTAARNAKMAELLDLGFRAAPSRVAVNRPKLPSYGPERPVAGKTIRVTRAVAKSQRPVARPAIGSAPEPVEAPSTRTAAIQTGIAEAVAAVTEAVTEDVTEAPAKPTTVAIQAPRSTAPKTSPTPPPRRVTFTSRRTEPTLAAVQDPIVISRASTSGGRHWGINVGRYPSRFAAERMLLKTALAEMSALDGALRKVAKSRLGFDANFVGMTEGQADLACRRLVARGVECTGLGPS